MPNHFVGISKSGWTEMDLSEFQKRALSTDRTGSNYENSPDKDVVVALLGVAGELGTLASTYKKHLRDGGAYQLGNAHLSEEIGDLLWYSATLASKFGLDLGDIAEANLTKTSDRWGAETIAPRIYDSSFPELERLPREFEVRFEEEEVDGRIKATMHMNGQPLGDPLTDNSEIADNYRFHDAFHLAFAALLGWSPVTRKLMGRKRRSVPAVDENQDGGRALVIEEGIAALAFEYGDVHGGLAGARAVDLDLLMTIKSMTKRLEVNDQSTRSWEEAIRAGWKIFRQLSEARKGTVICKLDTRIITMKP